MPGCMDELVLQAQNLAKKGTKELILIAQDLTYYGLDIYKGLDTRQQQYVLFAAGAALIGYGIYLGMNKK